MSSVSQVAAGNDFSIALDSNGKIWGWGALNNIFCESASIPIEMVDINEYIANQHTSVRKISAVENFVMVLLENGRMYALGRNPNGVCATR